MTRGEKVDIRTPEGTNPFPSRGQDIGHITGTDRQEPPPPSKVSFWPV